MELQALLHWLHIFITYWVNCQLFLGSLLILGGIAIQSGDIAKSRDYIVKLKGLIPSEGMTGSELLYGRAGYLYALLYVGSLVPGAGQDTKDLVEEQVRLLLDAGQMQAQADASPCPLSYIWHGKHYLGAAHGLAGILTVLLQVLNFKVFSAIQQAV